MSQMTNATTAGVLLFIHITAVPWLEHVLIRLNSSGRVSNEVLRLYTVIPTREAIQATCDVLREDSSLQELENIDRLKANNGLRDLTAPWRLDGALCRDYRLVVGLETVNPDFRHKYPIPNLTLQAGSVESGETTKQAALRELEEEACVRLNPELLKEPPLGLLGKGMLMYPCFITNHTKVRMGEGLCFIG